MSHELVVSFKKDWLIERALGKMGCPYEFKLEECLESKEECLESKVEIYNCFSLINCVAGQVLGKKYWPLESTFKQVYQKGFEIDEAEHACLIFTEGRTEIIDGAGHVGIVRCSQHRSKNKALSVIHASYSKREVVEQEFQEFLNEHPVIKYSQIIF